MRFSHSRSKRPRLECVLVVWRIDEVLTPIEHTTAGAVVRVKIYFSQTCFSLSHVFLIDRHLIASIDKLSSEIQILFG